MKLNQVKTKEQLEEQLEIEAKETAKETLVRYAGEDFEDYELKMRAEEVIHEAIIGNKCTYEDYGRILDMIKDDKHYSDLFNKAEKRINTSEDRKTIHKFRDFITTVIIQKVSWQAVEAFKDLPAEQKTSEAL